jgi:hypothetical protein
MDYTVKPETDAVAAPLLVCMAQRHHADDRVSATESKFYLPAGGTPSPEAGRLERIWATLFKHQVGTSK